ncbi:MAG: hypothetical protein AAFO89_02725, partial [Planctomycetota bacterium]
MRTRFITVAGLLACVGSTLLVACGSTPPARPTLQQTAQPDRNEAAIAPARAWACRGLALRV